jgi:hypothetical protein
MAACLNGLTTPERVALTLSMRDSGDVMRWDLPGPVVDKHSTGGLGDCTSLLLAPMLACMGVWNPMISGRGLGHTGGTLDKMEAIPGVVTEVPEDRFRAMVADIGCAIVSASGNLAPADKRLYAIRDVTSTVESSTSSPPRSCRRNSPPASTPSSSTSRPAPPPSWPRTRTPVPLPIRSSTPRTGQGAGRWRSSPTCTSRSPRPSATPSKWRNAWTPSPAAHSTRRSSSSPSISAPPCSSPAGPRPTRPPPAGNSATPSPPAPPPTASAAWWRRSAAPPTSPTAGATTSRKPL